MQETDIPKIRHGPSDTPLTVGDFSDFRVRQVAWLGHIRRFGLYYLSLSVVFTWRQTTFYLGAGRLARIQ
jgi:hypothetical protein